MLIPNDNIYSSYTQHTQQMKILEKQVLQTRNKAWNWSHDKWEEKYTT